VNKRFLRTLKAEFGRRQFTTKQAEAVYRRDHWEGSPRSARPAWFANADNIEAYIAKHPEFDDVQKQNVRMNAQHVRRPSEFTDMSARNGISAAVQFGLLKRVRKGVYRF
jgi:hypothetical protein